MGILLALLTIMDPAQANNEHFGDMPKSQQLAVRYISALTRGDYSALSQFYGRESLFIDKTANLKYKGNREILNFIKRVQKDVIEYKFSIEHMYNSQSLVILIGNYYFKGPGDLFGKPGKIIEIAVPGVTTLSVDLRKKRIKEHIDLIDYQTMSDQLAVQ